MRKLSLILPVLCLLISIAHGELPLPDAPQPQNPQPQNTAQQSLPPASATGSPGQEQPKRILGVIPNYRAVSAGTIPTPPGMKESFRLATQTSFDPPSIFFIGVTSMIAEGENEHPQLGKGIGGFGQYYWRGFADKTDGNYLVLFAFPALLHEDPRYFAQGESYPMRRRVLYSLGSIFVARNYRGTNTFNAAEVLGRGAAAAIGTTYYPASDRTIGDVMVKTGFALMRDAFTNAVREFWPDVATHILHRQP